MTRYPEPKVLLPDIPNELDRCHRARTPHRLDRSGKHMNAGLAIHVQPATTADQILSRFGLSKDVVEKIVAPAYLPGQAPASRRLPELHLEERQAERRRVCA